jgi:pimeloyl-ACP methyl ester carboxylesterase
MQHPHALLQRLENRNQIEAVDGAAEERLLTAEHSSVIRTGFRGGLNWYRNIDRNWELLASFSGAKVGVPALYVAGDRDPVLSFPGVKEQVANLAAVVPQLRQTIIVPGCGHWAQQERPEAVNAAMLDFLRAV